jgi:molybdenum cofactor cytidylyltransferase
MSLANGMGCIVLAAGSSRRFGADKRLALLADGSTLLAHTLTRIPASFTRRILVLGPNDQALAEPFLTAWQVIFAAQAQRGMGHSLAAALPLTTGWQGAVIALADMPFVLPATYTALQQALVPGRIVVPCWQGQRGNPVGIGAEFFPELASLQGDQGARMLLQTHAAAVLRLDVDDAGVVRDIDTQEALADSLLLR